MCCVSIMRPSHSSGGAVLILIYLILPLKDTYTHPLNGPFSGTARVSRYQKGKTNVDFTKARDSEWQ